MPRKAGLAGAVSNLAPGFNEAEAVMPRKGAEGESAA